MYRSQMPDEFSMQVSIPTDDDGYLDRECPNEACLVQFKILLEDWRDKVRDEEVFCPVCGHTAESGHWMTQEQLEYGKNMLLSKVMPMVGAEMKRMADNFNRSVRGNFLGISMSVKMSGPPPVIPIEAAELMRQRYTCEKCRCRYAAVGAAFFCPACGHNSAITAFTQTIETVRNLPQIRKVLESMLDRDQAANTIRHIQEDSLVKLVSAFQRYAEALYESLPNPCGKAPRKNLFQNLPESSDFWETVIGTRYESLVTSAKWTALQRYFQQRHLLAHKDGVVDDEYLRKTGDTQYQAGQRLVVKESGVLEFADLITDLAEALQASVAAASGACVDSRCDEKRNQGPECE